MFGSRKTLRKEKQCKGKLFSHVWFTMRSTKKKKKKKEVKYN